MTFDDFKEEILVSLGGNLVDVELEDIDYRVAFKKAKRTFIQKGANNMRREFMRLKVNTCQQAYMLPSNVDTIVKIVKPYTGFQVDDPLYIAAYNELFYDVVNNSNYGGFDFLSYELALQKIETFHKYMAYETQFHHDKHRNTIQLLDKPEKDTVWLLDCYMNLTDEEYMDTTWIIEWAVAECMEILGRAYSKFSALPSPSGGEVSLGGNELIEQARQKKEQLIEDILNGWDADPGGWEISFG